MGMHPRVAQPQVVEYVEWLLCNGHVPQNNGLCCLSHELTCGVWAIHHTQGLLTGNTLGAIINMCQAANVCCVISFICSSVHLVQELYCYKQLSCLVAYYLKTIEGYRMLESMYVYTSWVVWSVWYYIID